jgi:hypothetical protein
MGLFSKDTEEDAVKQIDNINAEMRAINAAIHSCNNQVCSYNRNDITSHLKNAENYARKYDRIKNGLQQYEQIMLMGRTVSVWNGESVGVFTWETYYRNVVAQLRNDLQYV